MARILQYLERNKSAGENEMVRPKRKPWLVKLTVITEFKFGGHMAIKTLSFYNFVFNLIISKFSSHEL